MPGINLNGKIVPHHSHVVEISNRGLRYGDGVFETMKWCDGRLVLADDHFERLWKGLEVLQFKIPAYFTPEFLTQQVVELVKHEKLSYSRVRLSVIRGNGGLFDLSQNHPLFLAEASPLDLPAITAQNNGAVVDIFRDARKMADILSPLKHNNYLPYCLAAIFAKKNNLHDALLLNQHGRICDSTMANIFFIKGNDIFTPALSEGCVAGIIRKNLLATLPELGYKIKETEIEEDMIKESDAAFLTNSILNLKAISAIANRKLDLSPALKLKELIEQKTELFC